VKIDQSSHDDHAQVAGGSVSVDESMAAKKTESWRATATMPGQSSISMTVSFRNSVRTRL